MQDEIFGRLKLVKHHTSWAIISKKKLEDSFDSIPRTVLHVGSPKYIQNIWNKMIRNHAWLEDAKTWK